MLHHFGGEILFLLFDAFADGQAGEGDDLGLGGLEHGVHGLVGVEIGRLDGLRIVASAIKSNVTNENSFLIITHYNRILSHIKPNFVHIMRDGKIERSGGEELAHEINEKGYSASKVKVK